jgi:flagellar basal-body rod protein FlgB
MASLPHRWIFTAFSHGMPCAFGVPNHLEFVMASLEQSLSVFSQAMNLRSQRQQVLASNIANADTPNYKARDFSFEKAMQNAMAGRGSDSLAMTTTASGHLPGAGGSGMAALQFRSETQSAVDGNTVDMDVERTQMTENALQYQIVSQFVSDQFKGLRSALANTNS